ncbi:MAG: hypothetical protein KAW16_06410 [candidate division Zixibacteria bacterium]|nr:hypothetical protein [candidate division Zixibacteria bacterium]
MKGDVDIYVKGETNPSEGGSTSPEPYGSRQAHRPVFDPEASFDIPPLAGDEVQTRREKSRRADAWYKLVEV